MKTIDLEHDLRDGCGACPLSFSGGEACALGGNHTPDYIESPHDCPLREEGAKVTIFAAKAENDAETLHRLLAEAEVSGYGYSFDRVLTDREDAILMAHLRACFSDSRVKAGDAIEVQAINPDGTLRWIPSTVLVVREDYFTARFSENGERRSDRFSFDAPNWRTV